MILEIIGLIVVVIEVIGIFSNFIEEHGCMGWMILLFTSFIYLYFNNTLRLIMVLLLSITTLYMMYNDGKVTGADYDYANAERCTATEEDYYYEQYLDNKRYSNNVSSYNQQFIQPQYNVNLKPGDTININTASIEEIIALPSIGLNRANELLTYRQTHHISSVDDLVIPLGLAKNEKNAIRPYLRFDDYTQPERPTYNDRINYRQEREELNNQIDNEINNVFDRNTDKPDEKVEPHHEEPIQENVVIDINAASDNELKKLPGINLIKAKKIVQLRDSGVYINSIDDLQQKLNLKDYEVNQLKSHITISKHETENKGRRLDL